MFEDSLVESTHRIRTQNRWSFAVSIGLQAMLAALIVAVPLMHPETLQRLALSPPMLIAPPAPVPPPPQPVRVERVVSDASAAPSAPALQQLLPARMHSAVDYMLRAQDGPEAPPGVTANISMVSSVGDPSGLANAVGAAVRPSVSAAHPAKPTAISTGVLAGMLIAPIQPVYPPIAKASHTEGTVVIHAIISKTGVIESANVVSGSLMLAGAALDAVRAAHYRPYRLNGEPTEVETTISINFRLSS